MLLLLSARSEERLAAYVAVIQDSIAARPELDLVDMTYTLQVGRDAMDHRLAICADSRQALLDGLAVFRAQRYAERVLVGRVRKSRDGAAILARCFGVRRCEGNRARDGTVDRPRGDQPRARQRPGEA